MLKYSTQRTLLAAGLTLVLGLGAGLALPLLAGIQGKAAGLGMEYQVESSPGAVNTIYVAQTGDGSAATLGWSTAFTNVQDALDAAASLGNSEIWVASGVYYPDVGNKQINNAVTSTFLMTDTVALYGGFDISDTAFSERDWVNNVTVLSGDIDGNDKTDINGIVITPSNITSDNAHHVVTANGVTGTAVLDGFFVTAGDALGLGWPDNSGGGFYCAGSGSGGVCNPKLANTYFSGNRADNGGAFFSYGAYGGISAPVLEGVIFSGNFAVSGGGMNNYGFFGGTSNPSLTMVDFYINSASSPGGAVNNTGTQGRVSIYMDNVKFIGNYAGNGGAVANWGPQSHTSAVTMTNVILQGNSAKGLGGALYNFAFSGGASDLYILNTTFSGNLANVGGAIFNKTSSGGTVNPLLRNTILWNNQDSSGPETISSTIVNIESFITITHSLVQSAGPSGSGVWLTDPIFVDGGNNIDVDPLFITPVSPTTAPTTTGDLRLQSGSPAIDKGFNDYVIGVLADLDDNPRVMDGDSDGTTTVDMGAYEYQIPYKYDGYLPYLYR